MLHQLLAVQESPQTKAACYQKFGVIELSEAIWRFVIGTVSVGMGAGISAAFNAPISE